MTNRLSKNYPSDIKRIKDCGGFPSGIRLQRVSE